MNMKILIANPNSNAQMTESLRRPVDEALGLGGNGDITPTLTTAPSPSPHSINNLPDTHLSTTHAFPALLPLLPHHDAVLIACFSPHPLVGEILRWDGERRSSLSLEEEEEEETGMEKGEGREGRRRRRPLLVTGILESSTWAAVGLLSAASSSSSSLKSGGMDEGEESKQTQKKFGIVSTGPQWKAILNDAIGDILGEEGKGRWFAGTECVGVDAGGLHAEGGSVKEKVMGATGRLMGRGDVGVVVLGCAGMVGMEGWVREVAGEGVAVVDGVKAGVGLLQGWLRGGFFGGRGEDKRVGGETEGEMRMQVGATEEVYKAEENERMVEMSKRQRTD